MHVSSSAGTKKAFFSGQQTVHPQGQNRDTGRKPRPRPTRLGSPGWALQPWHLQDSLQMILESPVFSPLTALTIHVLPKDVCSFFFLIKMCASC